MTGSGQEQPRTTGCCRGAPPPSPWDLLFYPSLTCTPRVSPAGCQGLRPELPGRGRGKKQASVLRVSEGRLCQGPDRCPCDPMTGWLAGPWGTGSHMWT